MTFEYMLHIYAYTEQYVNSGYIQTRSRSQYLYRRKVWRSVKNVFWCSSKTHERLNRTLFFLNRRNKTECKISRKSSSSCHKHYTHTHTNNPQQLSVWKRMTMKACYKKNKANKKLQSWLTNAIHERK